MRLIKEAGVRKEVIMDHELREKHMAIGKLAALVRSVVASGFRARMAYGRNNDQPRTYV